MKRAMRGFTVLELWAALLIWLGATCGVHEMVKHGEQLQQQQKVEHK